MNIEQLKAAWNSQADRHNQLDELGIDEIVSFAQTEVERSRAWKRVATDGYPDCDCETVFVGINSAGFCGCFNSITGSPKYSHCWYETAEDSVDIMSDLALWKPLAMPGSETVSNFEKLVEFLTTIAYTGLSADEASEHAIAALEAVK